MRDVIDEMNNCPIIYSINDNESVFDCIEWYGIISHLCYG